MFRVTEADRKHFLVVAEAEALSEAESFDRAARRSPEEGVREGLRLSRLVAWSPAQRAQLDADSDQQMELARRRIAMRLGLGRRD